jgi:hypothetical protein
VTLNQWKHSGFYLNDKEATAIVGGVKSRQAEAAVAALASFVNAFLLGLYKGVYGFTGTPGTTPFATTVVGLTANRAILNRQLAPMADRRMVLDVNAEANALGLPQFSSWQQVGDTKAIIEGTIGRRFGFDVAMDQQVPTHPSVPFTAGAVTVNGVNAVNAGSPDGGRTGTISLNKITNAGTLIQGDILTFAGDAQTYVVTAPVALIVGNTTVPIAPALQIARTGGEAVTLQAAHVVNLGFHRDAISFASRPLMATSANTVELLSIADPVSGLTLRMEAIRQNKQVFYDFDILFGAALVRPELAARLAG